MVSFDHVDPLDIALIKLLQAAPLHTAALAKKIHVPYTKVHYRLERLAKRGVILKGASGWKGAWHIRHKAHLGREKIQVFSGNNFVKAYQPLLTLKKNTVVYVLQGAKVVSPQGKVPISLGKKVHKVLKRRHIVMKSFIHREMLKHFSMFDTNFLESHTGRALGIRAFSDADGFLGSGEIFVAPTFACFSNPLTGRAVLLKDVNVVAMLYDSFAMFFDLLEHDSTVRNLDLNDFLRQLISKRVT